MVYKQLSFHSLTQTFSPNHKNNVKSQCTTQYKITFKVLIKFPFSRLKVRSSVSGAFLRPVTSAALRFQFTAMRNAVRK